MMSSWAPQAERLIATPKGSSENGHTRVRVQVVPLCICAVASSAFVSATNLPWFGDLSSGNGSLQYSAVSASGLYAPPGSQTALRPGTQSWGYLLVAWSALLTVLAVTAIAACVVSRHRRRAGLNVLLLSVGIASVVLIALIVPEFTARVQTDLVSFVGFSWGAMVGLGLAVVAASGAWFAWATLKFPHLWGVEITVD
jgi:hypothetical protein